MSELSALKSPIRYIIAIPILIGLFVVALGLDIPVAIWFRDSGWAPIFDTTYRFLRWPGEYRLAILIAIPLFIFHKQTWRTGGFILLTGLPGIINFFIKWIVGRSRPFKWAGPWDLDFFHGGFHGLFKQTNLTFASGHSTQAFATATGLAIVFPRFWTAFYVLAALTGFQRVASTDHYLSDALAGAVLGVVTVRLLFHMLLKFVPPATDSQRGFEVENPTPRPERTVMPERIEMEDANAPYLSLVIPCFNEEENVPTLLSRVEASLNLLGKPFEVIIVDDGSTDKTPQMLAEAQTRLPWLRVLRMQKNAGQSAGFEAGFAAAKGQLIATIDADLQNDPEEVPRIAKMLDEMPDVDMITGWRKDRQDTNFRRWQSRQANRIRNWISQDNINDSACSLKVYRNYTLKGLKLFNGAHRFFPALVKMRGYNVFETPVKHSHRFAGTAKYGFRNRAFRALIDLIGVRWMKMRYLRYQASETRPTE